MPTGSFLCSRPHPRFVNFETSRFVVGTAAGLKIGDRRLQMGDEIPQGSLPPDALQREYEAPPRNIELLEYALTIPALREACAQRGVDVEAALQPPDPPAPPPVDPPPPPPKPPLPDLEKLTKEEVLDLCKKHKLPVHGSFRQIRERLQAHLG